MNKNITKIKGNNVPFVGLNSKLVYVDIENLLEGDKITLQKARTKILKSMDKRETALLLSAKEKFKNKKLFFIRRKVSPEIAKLMGAETDEFCYRAIIVNPCPISKAKDRKLYYGVYGYETIIIAGAKVKTKRRSKR